MFNNSGSNPVDLDFELVEESPSQTNSYATESLLKDLLSSNSSNARIIKPSTAKRSMTTNTVRRQLTDDSLNKQRTPPNSVANSVSPITTSFFTRLSQENPTVRLTNVPNTIRMTSPASNKASDTMTLLLKPNVNTVPIVQTRLENPTKYHLEQISRKQTLANDMTPTTTILSSAIQQEESSPDSEITSEMDDQLNDETTSASIDSHSRGISITPRLSTTLTNEHIGSVFLSSSLSKESPDSSQRHSSSCPTNILSAKAKIGLPLTEDEMRLVLRDRQKKDNHNMIERRRRFNINDRIKELGTLLPKGTELDLKQNKGTILRASVDYIKILQRQYENAMLVEEKCQLLTEENLALQERVKDLERKCLLNGVTIQSSNPINKTSSAIPMVNTHVVKQEPSSLSSSLNNNPLVPPSTPITSTFDSFQAFDPSLKFSLDDDSNDTNSMNNPSNNRGSLSPLKDDPFLSSTLFGLDNEMDIGTDLV